MTCIFTVEQQWSDGSLPPIEHKIRVVDMKEAMGIYRSGLPVVINDTMEIDAAKAHEKIFEESSMIRAAVGVPFIREGKFGGGFSVHDNKPRNWTAEEITLIKDVAERTRLAIERLNAETALHQSEARHAFLLRFNDKMRNIHTPDEVEKTAINITGVLFELDAVCYSIPDIATSLIFVQREWTRDGQPFLKGTHEFDDFGPELIHWFNQGKMLTMENLDKDALLSDYREAYKKAGIAAFVSVPILRKGMLARVFSAISKSPRKWTEQEKTLFKNIAERTWDEVERARGEQELKRSTTDLEQKVKERTGQLQAQKDFADTIINTSGDLVCVYDPQMCIITVNKACEDLLGLKKEDIVGRHFLDVFPASKNTQAHKDLKRAIQGEPVKNDLFFSHATNRYYQNFITPLKNEEGKTYAVVSIAHDITEIYRFAEKIKQSEERFNILFDLSPVAITVAEYPSGRIVMNNENFTRLFGYNQEEIMGKTPAEIGLVTTEDNDKARDAFNKNGCLKNAQFTYYTRSGDEIHVLASVELITLGKSKYYLGTYTDINERVKLEKLLEDKNAELNLQNDQLASFTYVASHDLQEPIRKIRMFSGRILSKEGNRFSQQARDYFDRIMNAAQRMQDLIDSLLNYSRLNSGDYYEDLDLQACVQDARQVLQELIDEKHAVIEAEALPVIKAIPVQFRQLLINIISNSLKYAKEGVPPLIQVKATVVAAGELIQLPDSVHKNYWKISVKDNGIGFDQQYASRIFELFQRLHDKTEYSGTGIGLTICKKIVQNHQGFITAQGVEGVGATFSVYIPVDLNSIALHENNENPVD